MATVTVGHSYDGPKWTVNDLIKHPVRVPNIVKELVKDNNIAEWLLREGPTAVGGAVSYEEQVALYASNEGEIVAEFGEIPGVEVPMRTPVVRATTKRGVHLKISEEMRTRNDVGRVQDEMRMVKDTLVNGRDKVFFDAVTTHPLVGSFAASGAATSGWANPDPALSGIRKDVAKAMYQLASQEASGAQYGEKLGYQANTMIIHPSVESFFIDSDEINRIFASSPLASEQLRYTGKMPKKFMGLDVMKSWRMDPTKVIVCQRGIMGFISKEWPLTGTPLRKDEDTQSWRSNFTYRDLVGIDNPKSVWFITGIQPAI